MTSVCFQDLHSFTATVYARSNEVEATGYFSLHNVFSYFVV